MRVARRKLDQLNQAVVIGDLRAPPSNRLEKLKGEREGQYPIRINDQWRVCSRWTEFGCRRCRGSGLSLKGNGEDGAGEDSV